MKHKIQTVISQNKVLAVLTVLVFLLVFLLSLLTPMASDDFAYSFSFADWTRIRSVAEIFPSMAVHRTTTNGRVLVHGLVQLMLMLPRAVFSLLNACMAVVLLGSLRRLISVPDKHEEWMILLFAVCFLCCFSPALGENTLWLTGAVNYGWTVALSLVFLLPFLNANFSSEDARPSTWQTALRMLLAFYVGTCSENVSLVTIALAVFFWLVTCFRAHRIRIPQLLWILSSVIGYVFLMSAPATAGRSGTLDVSALGYQVRLVFQAAQQYLLIPFLVFSCLFALGLFYRINKRKLVAAAALFVGGLCILASYIFAAYLVKRHLFFTVFFTMAACCVLLAALCETGQRVFPHLALAGISVLFLLQFPVGVLDIAISFHKQQEREQQIHLAKEGGEQSVVLENYYPYTSYGVAFMMDPERPEANINVSDYYGLESVLGLDPPEESVFQ